MLPGLRAALALTAIFAIACQHSENRYLRRQVHAVELHGEWAGTPFAMKSLADVGFTTHLDPGDHWLILMADGTCSAQTFLRPYVQIDGIQSDWLTPDVPCRWSLDSDRTNQSLDLWFETEPGREEHAYYYFDEEEDRLLLWRYATDPDAWRYMEFVKVGEAP
ncbi:MAG TPA: hypothetical protein VEK15_18510 [Vicinamibacteria bacterium]|nr:hypothetical protein [Vicinamibacteria bacterium]